MTKADILRAGFLLGDSLATMQANLKDRPDWANLRKLTVTCRMVIIELNLSKQAIALIDHLQKSLLCQWKGESEKYLNRIYKIIRDAIGDKI